MTNLQLPPVGLFEDFCVDSPDELRGYAEAMLDRLGKLRKGGDKEGFNRDDICRGTVWLVGCYHEHDLVPCWYTTRLVAELILGERNRRDIEIAELKSMYPYAGQSGIKPNNFANYEKAIQLEAKAPLGSDSNDLFPATSYSIAAALVDSSNKKPADPYDRQKKIDIVDSTIRAWRKREDYQGWVRHLREDIFAIK